MSDLITRDQLAGLAQRAAALDVIARAAFLEVCALADEVAQLAGDITELETAAAAADGARLYELDLACGDTIASARYVPTSTYRKCIHCGSRKRVIRVRMGDSVLAAKPGPAPADETLDQLRKHLSGGM